MTATQINGFTDIHTHILPGVDDGAVDAHQARELVRMAWNNGTRTLFLTPHYRGVYRKNDPLRLKESFSAFSQFIAEDFPGMRLYLGSEIHYEADVPELLEKGKILTLNDSQYVLLEFRSGVLYSQVIAAISESVRYGFTPVIAHVDRYAVFLTNRSLVDEVLNMGALIQLNVDSVMGKNGFRVKRFCQNLLKFQKVHFIASDAHDTLHRPPLLRDCFLRVCKLYGAEYAAQVFYYNAQAIIENGII